MKNSEQFVHKMINSKMENGDVLNIGTREEREGFDEKEYRKILKTQNQGMVKYQKYRLSKGSLFPKINSLVSQIEKMKPELLMLSSNSSNKQVLILSDEEDFKNIKSKVDFEKAAMSSTSKLPESALGKRSFQQLQNLEKLGGADASEITEFELKAGIQAKKKAYKKLADNLVKNEKLQDYLLQIDLEKSLLVSVTQKQKSLPIE